jgi:hypothetical protein
MLELFDEIVWQADHMIMRDLVFRLEHNSDEKWEGDTQCFRFYKDKRLMDQYREFWSTKPNFSPKNILELGIWDGGSMVFWSEFFRPTKLVAIDLAKKEDSKYFLAYKDSRKLHHSLKTYWGVDQSDSRRLREISKADFTGPLDLVIDDASHVYESTKASFETLFPLLRNGGIYIIEDWAWSHWREFQAYDHKYFGGKTELTKLIVELVEAAGSSQELIRQISIYRGLVAIERGPVRLSETFQLEDYICRRPKLAGHPKFSALYRHLKAAKMSPKKLYWRSLAHLGATKNRSL